MEAFYRIHNYLVEHTSTSVRRELMDEIDWSHRLIGIKGTRGVGKTTFLLQYAKEKFGNSRSCLFVNMNNFYFAGHTIVEFAGDFINRGGRVLLIDQVFKYPDWSKELHECYERYPMLKIVFTGSTVMQLEEDNPELSGIVKSYKLHGFSFREFLSIRTGVNIPKYSLQEIVENHEYIAKTVLSKIRPLDYFQDYLHHGYYPVFLEKQNFSENLLKTMNMMIEVDILLIRQVELKYLSKIKSLFYQIALTEAKAPNVSKLAKDVETSRATVMNYVKYLADAELLTMIYPEGEDFPRKPSKLIMDNTNIMYAISPVMIEDNDLVEAFLINNIGYKNKITMGDKNTSFVVNGKLGIKACPDGSSPKKVEGVVYAMQRQEIGRENEIPMWMFGLLY